MPRIHERRTLPYRPGELFDLVADVERYPEFIGWCEDLTVTARKTEGAREILTARMTAHVKMFREQLLCRVTLDRPAARIEVRYLDGPFRHLDNVWQFEGPEEGPTTIDFRIDFEFAGLQLRLLAAPFMGEISDRLVRTFLRRADALYGAPSLV
ncbi:MAG: type II toxin-antitoxin system RatA family toxin [Alphaproteobacteria bacterium]|nr:type II toxin-antitoxin system RatA family toxin [Alphaproteobacteria bacterium]